MPRDHLICFLYYLLKLYSFKVRTSRIVLQCLVSESIPCKHWKCDELCEVRKDHRTEGCSSLPACTPRRHKTAPLRTCPWALSNFPFALDRGIVGVWFWGIVFMMSPSTFNLPRQSVAAYPPTRWYTVVWAQAKRAAFAWIESRSASTTTTHRR